MISHVHLLGAILRMVAAVLVGCIVGLDRNLHGKPTGVKTLGLVALGSCLVTMAGMSFELHGFTDGSDAGRAIQGVITGIGFLGAGVILQNRATGKISGLTTAASIWVTAALGIVCGIGAWQIAGIATSLLLLLLSVIAPTAPSVMGLQAMRGVQFLTAIGMLSELGDLSRFEHPRQLMAWLGVTPSEHSSGERRRQGSITKNGNSYARKLLVEAAWSYRYPARVSPDIQRGHEGIPKHIIDRAWDAQVRLRRRYRKPAARGKNVNIAVVAVARELAGFIWDISRLAMSLAVTRDAQPA